MLRGDFKTKRKMHHYFNQKSLHIANITINETAVETVALEASLFSIDSSIKNPEFKATTTNAASLNPTILFVSSPEAPKIIMAKTSPTSDIIATVSIRLCDLLMVFVISLPSFFKITVILY
jgi:hypothetical protein